MSQRGFTLIELLIVVTILGVLVAVVIPNVARFIGRGEPEAADIELGNIQTAVVLMMVDNSLGSLPHPEDTVATANMSQFPDKTSVAGSDDKKNDPDGTPYAAEDRGGYLLYGHDIKGGGSPGPLINYVYTETTKGTYIVDASGTVTQVTTGHE